MNRHRAGSGHYRGGWAWWSAKNSRQETLILARSRSQEKAWAQWQHPNFCICLGVNMYRCRPSCLNGSTMWATVIPWGTSGSHDSAACLKKAPLIRRITNCSHRSLGSPFMHCLWPVSSGCLTRPEGSQYATYIRLHLYNELSGFVGSATSTSSPNKNGAIRCQWLNDQCYLLYT